MEEKKYTKIYKRIYDGKEEGFNDEQYPNELLGEFEIIYGSMGYAFSLIGVEKETGKIYNIVGDEVSGLYNPGNGGTKCSIYEIVLREGHWC